MATHPSKLSLQEHQRQHLTHNSDRSMLHVQAPVNLPPPKQTRISRMPRTTRNPAPPLLDKKLSPVQKRLQTTPLDHTDTMRIHCHLELGEHSQSGGGSWIRSSKPPRTKVTVTSCLTRDELAHENCIDSSVIISTAPLPSHASNSDPTQAPTETGITPHSFDIPLHQTSPLGFPARSSSEEETVAETRGTEDSPTLSPPTSLQTNEPRKLPLVSSEKGVLQCDTDGTDLLRPLPSPIPSVVDLPLTIHLQVGTTTSECPIFPVADGMTADDTRNGEAKSSQEQSISSSPIDTDIPTLSDLSITAKHLSPLTQTGHADLGIAIEEPPAPMQNERDAQRAEQTDACTQEPEKSMASSIPEFENGPGFADNVGGRLEETLGLPFCNEVLNPSISKSEPATTVSQSEQNDLPVLSVTSGSPSSTETPIVAPHQTANATCSPILPLLPESYADFGDVLRLLSPDKDDIPAERTAASTSHLTDLFIPRRAHTELLVSPTRTLFPSVSQDFEMIERVVIPQDDMTRAGAASLRFRNKRLEDECNEWRQKHDELELKHHELEKKCKDRERGLADLAAAGAEWLPCR